MTDYLRGNQDCYKYTIKWWHFLFPTIDEISTLCESHDKSYLFLVVLLRTIFYIFVYMFLYYKSYIMPTTINMYKFIGYVTMVVLMAINVLSLINLYITQQLIKKKEIKKEPEKLIHFPIKMIKPVPKTDAEIELAAILKAETDARQELVGEVIDVWRKEQEPHDEVLFKHLKRENI